MRRPSWALLVVAGLMWASPALAETALFLEVTGDPTAQEREHEVFEELALALDALLLARAAAPAPAFTSLPLNEQLAALRPSLSGDVIAALWMDPSSADPLRVQLAFASLGGRAEVRLVEEPAGPGAAAVIALGVREVLATATARWSQPPAPTPEPAPQALAPQAQIRRGAIGVDLGFTVGTPARQGPNTRFAVGVVGDVLPGRGFAFGPVGVFRFSRDGETSLLATGLGGGLRVGWTGGKQLRLGPFVGVTAVWHRVRITAAGAPLVADDLQIRVPVGLSVRGTVNPAVEIVGHLGVDLLPRRNRVRLRSNEAVLLDTGPLDVSFLVGLRFLP